MYYFLERSMVIIKPKQPLLDWVNQSFIELPQPLTLDSVRIDCNTYLIPEVNELEDGINYIDEQFADLFELELNSWTDDKKLWPQELTLKMFWEWFDVEVHSTVIDTASDLEEQEPEASTIH